MLPNTRRDFLRNVGSGMLIAGVGASVAADLGFGSEFAFDDRDSLSFGNLDGLVDLMQQMPAERLQVKLVEKLRSGELKLDDLVAAAALANAETFGGEDYVGYHTEMALVPALEMSGQMPKDRRPLPVLKVLFRNAQQIQTVGGAKKKTLKTIEAGKVSGDLAKKLRHAARNTDLDTAEQLFASAADVPIHDAYNALLPTIEDDIDVHRFVLAHRALELVDVVGQQHAHTMLRQCVRYCVQSEQNHKQRGRPTPVIRKLVPKLIDQYGLMGIQLGDRDPGDPWVTKMADEIHLNDELEACDSVAAALADGIAPDAIAESISLAANQLLLRQGADRWRTHGDSPGVHASDAANAWRNMIKVADHGNVVAGLICSAYHTAQYQSFRSDPYPLEAHRLKVKTTDAKELLGLAAECIRANDQAVAAAAIQIYGEQNYSPEPVFELMLRYAISEDGRLHAEKYYCTVREEFKACRPAFRWRQLVALARATASQFGYDRNDNRGHRAPGYLDACELLGVQS